MQRAVHAPLLLHYQISECETIPVETVLHFCIAYRKLADYILYYVAL